MSFLNKLFKPNVDELKAKKDVIGLINLLQSKNEQIRERAAEALGEIKDERAIQPLIAVLGKGDYVKDALVMIGKPAVEPLIVALRYSDEYRFRDVLEVLFRINDERTVEPLITALLTRCKYIDLSCKRLKDENKKFSCMRRGKKEKESILYNLVNIGEPAVEPLIVALTDENDVIKEIAARVLGEIKNGRAIKPLIVALATNKGYNVRENVRKALINIGEPAVEPLIAALKVDTLNFLSGNEKEFRVEDLVTNLKLRESFAKENIFHVLGEIKDNRAIEPLISVLRDEEYSVQLMVQKALVKIGKPVVKHLIALLKDESYDVKIIAAKALGEIKDECAVEPLIVAWRNEDCNHRERKEIEVALNNILDPKVSELLIASLQREQNAENKRRKEEGDQKIRTEKMKHEVINKIDEVTKK